MSIPVLFSLLFLGLLHLFVDSMIHFVCWLFEFAAVRVMFLAPLISPFPPLYWQLLSPLLFRYAITTINFG